MNNRRNLHIVLGAASFTPQTLFAQAKKPPVVIGWLAASTAETGARRFTAFKEGQRFVIDARWTKGRIETAQPVAEELAAKLPNIILTQSSSASVAAANASQNIPIVQASGASPVDVGLAAVLASSAFRHAS
jgi:hypothetical protein